VKALLLTFKPTTDPRIINCVREHAYENALQYVQNELVKNNIALHGRQVKLDSNGVPPSYVALDLRILEDLETALANTDTIRQLQALQIENAQLKEKLSSQNTQSSMTVADLQVKLNQYESENQKLREMVAESTNELTSLKSELQKLSRADKTSHHCFIDLRLQTLNYKSDVFRHLDSLLATVRSRVGYVPREVEEEVATIKNIQVQKYLKYVYILLILLFSIRIVCVQYPAASPSIHLAAGENRDITSSRSASSNTNGKVGIKKKKKVVKEK
jgi:hypothetical protein